MFHGHTIMFYRLKELTQVYSRDQILPLFGSIKIRIEDIENKK